MLFRRILLALAMLIGLAAATLTADSARFSTAQPNIIFVLVDDLDADLIDFMPRLKSLVVEQGTMFVNFFNNVTLCCPSRASILRGQYSHNTQILTNQLPTGGFQKFYALGYENATVATWL